MALTTSTGEITTRDPILNSGLGLDLTSLLRLGSWLRLGLELMIGIGLEWYLGLRCGFIYQYIEG